MKKEHLKRKDEAEGWEGPFPSPLAAPSGASTAVPWQLWPLQLPSLLEPRCAWMPLQPVHTFLAGAKEKLGKGKGEMSLERRNENSVSGGAGGDGESILVPFPYGSDYTDWGKWWRVKGK